jgi:hypothetical protein
MMGTRPGRRLYNRDMHVLCQTGIRAGRLHGRTRTDVNVATTLAYILGVMPTRRSTRRFFVLSAARPPPGLAFKTVA